MYRIGKSTDIHRLVFNRPLIIGGVQIKSTLGLLGHSDADVLLHAIAEAILGALGKDDLGVHFSDEDNQYKDIKSTIILEKVYQIMIAENYVINNLDSLVIIEKPKLRNYIHLMKKTIAEILKTDEKNINIKATCSEGMGFVGTHEGAIAEAVVLLKRKD